jgi:hypothetical protein
MMISRAVVVLCLGGVVVRKPSKQATERAFGRAAYMMADDTKRDQYRTYNNDEIRYVSPYSNL